MEVPCLVVGVGYTFMVNMRDDQSAKRLREVIWLAMLKKVKENVKEDKMEEKTEEDEMAEHAVGDATELDDYEVGNTRWCLARCYE